MQTPPSRRRAVSNTLLDTDAGCPGLAAMLLAVIAAALAFATIAALEHHGQRHHAVYALAAATSTTYATFLACAAHAIITGIRRHRAAQDASTQTPRQAAQQQ